MGIFASLKKSKKLRQISKKLDTPTIASVEDLLNYNAQDREKALDELCDLCLADSNIIQVMNKYGIGKEKLKELYNRMCAVGFGQWVNGHYVAASSISYVATLDYLLRNETTKDFPNVAFRVHSYFMNGEMAPFIS